VNQPLDNPQSRGSKILHSVVHLILLLVISDDLINLQLACLANLKFLPVKKFLILISVAHDQSKLYPQDQGGNNILVIWCYTDWRMIATVIKFPASLPYFSTCFYAHSDPLVVLLAILNCKGAIERISA